MWNFRTPSPADYDSEEEYQAALAAYDAAESDYEDEGIERYFDMDNY